MFDYSVGMFSYLRHLSLLDLIASSTRACANAEHYGVFTLEPVSKDGKTTYLAHGKVAFFGDEAMARTGGAGARLAHCSHGSITPQITFRIEVAA